MKTLKALLLISLIFLAASIRANELKITLKWSSIPERMEAHEFYIRNDQALYLVRKDAVEMDGERAYPEWLTEEVSREELMHIAKNLNAIVTDIDKTKEKEKSKNPNRRFCHGFVWALDINVEGYNLQYHATCDSPEVRDRVQKLVKSVIGDP